jgi:hypothetical protein
MARIFRVEEAGNEWVVSAPGVKSGTFPNQQLAIDAAMALAAEDGGLVTWRDEYIGEHTANPARLGWFSDEVRSSRGTPPSAGELSGSH